MSDSPILREDYVVFHPISTRWMDNDVYGHVNNVTYYSYFDTAVNHYLIEKGGLNIHNSPIVGYVVESNCTYCKGIAYPDHIEVGLRVNRLGNSSVQYGLGIFKVGDAEACAYGSFVHVFVDRALEKAAPIPEKLRQALAELQTG